MERASVFVFTSNRMEGWGAVVNEAMSGACAVVASHAVGSVPFLISDGVNGVVYESGKVVSLTESVAALLDAPDKAETLGRSAHDTLVGEWNAESAAARLLTLAEHLLRGDESFAFDDGPCSRAEIVKDNWYKRR
jgi:glycosyltransferase involved in cell wall biosynthesis